MPTRYVIGLGSNLGERLTHLDRAVTALGELGRVTAHSAVYESEAFGGPEQGPFLNAAVVLEARVEPRGLLLSLLEIERRLGRERRERWGPRTLDLDILWREGVVVREAGLVIPHERLVERTFALRPLLDVVPDAAPPAGQEPYGEVLARLSHPALRRVAEPLDWAKGL